MSKSEIKNETIETIDATKIVNLEQVIKLNELQENSVLVIRLQKDSPHLMQVLKSLASRYQNLLREKKISVISILPEDQIEVLKEEKMNKLGWFKEKKKNLIVT